MDLEAVIEEIEAALDTIAGLRILVVGERPVPPAAYVSYPESITYGESYARGMDSMELQVVLVVGRTIDRATRKALAAYCKGSGSASVKAVVDGHTYTACDSVTVTGAEFDVVTVSGVDLMAAIFSVDVVGTGA